MVSQIIVCLTFLLSIALVCGTVIGCMAMTHAHDQQLKQLKQEPREELRRW